MIVVDQEEIIEIAAHFPGRIHGGIQVKILSPVGKRREFAGQYVGLDLRRDAELSAGPCLLPRDFDQVLQVPDDSSLHGADLMVQIFDLVMAVEVQINDVRGCILPLFLSEFSGLGTQLIDRLRDVAPHKKYAGRGCDQ